MNNDDLYGIDYKYSGEVLRECTRQELLSMLHSAGRKKLELKTEYQLTGKTKPHLMRKVRRDIARIKTVLHEHSRQ